MWRQEVLQLLARQKQTLIKCHRLYSTALGLSFLKWVPKFVVSRKDDTLYWQRWSTLFVYDLYMPWSWSSLLLDPEKGPLYSPQYKASSQQREAVGSPKAWSPVWLWPCKSSLPSPNFSFLFWNMRGLNQMTFKVPPCSEIL